MSSRVICFMKLAGKEYKCIGFKEVESYNNPHIRFFDNKLPYYDLF